MKNILGLDLGTGSVGWALIKTTDDGKPISISKIGIRRVPLAEGEDGGFSQGQSFTVNAERTTQRTARKCYDRYQLRRQALTEELRLLNMLPDEKLIRLPVLELWSLRAKAVTCQISLPEIGRVLYHLNQKRGYKHGDKSLDTKQRDYVAEINNRYKDLKAKGLTIGQFFSQKLSETAVRNSTGVFVVYRIKDQVYPRIAYEEEFDAIMRCQQQYYPDLLTDEKIDHIRNHIIYYQRDLKSCKHLVSVCEFEKRAFKDSDGNFIRDKKGNIVYDGPKTTPRTSPLFQLYKNWEAVNNIVFRNKRDEELPILLEQRQEMILHLESNELLKLSNVQDILGMGKKSGWYSGKQFARGIQGNTTRMEIQKALSHLSEEDVKRITRFDLKIVDREYVDLKTDEKKVYANSETGEVLQKVCRDYEKEPLYRLWHILYSIPSNKKDLRTKALTKFLAEFGVDDEYAIEKLCELDFTTPGYSNVSAKFISNVLPYLQLGLMYSDACEYAGYRHSNKLTNEENNTRELLDKIPAIKKNELHQPTVEKILNQMINIFNELNGYLRGNGEGSIDEVRIELARELKQSREERESTWKQLGKLERENAQYKTLIGELGLKVTSNKIRKYKLYRESSECCFYCGQPVNLKSFLEGTEEEREHILPKKLILDNSFANQVCSCRKCNATKGGRTAYDFMRTQPGFEAYVDKVERMYQEKKIGGEKRKHLLASYEDYLIRKSQGKETKDDVSLWEQFIERQLRLSQYISRKSVEILRQGCRNVYATSGSVTDFLRHTWGYDRILHDLNFPRYKEAGLVETEANGHKGQEVIPGWNKRKDHRHHAIDALTIACTNQSIIQRINTLSASREEMFSELKLQNTIKNEDYTLLENWVSAQEHFTTSQVSKSVAEILVSIKAGKRATTPGKRKTYRNGKPIVQQTGIIVPRGALHEKTVYGQIVTKKQEADGTEEIKPEIVVRYPLAIGQGCVFNGKEKCDVIYDKKTNSYILQDEIEKAIEFIVDKHIRKVIIDAINDCFPEGCTYRTNAENALLRGEKYDSKDDCSIVFKRIKELSSNPIYADKDKNICVKRVRCYTGLKAVQPLKYHKGEPISFVKTGNNHHVAIYKDSVGKLYEMTTTFWQAVERKRYGIPICITEPKTVWDNILLNDPKVSEEVLEHLPNQYWTLYTILSQNDMFVLGMSDEEFLDAMSQKDKSTLSSHLYRVQSISEGDYWFRLHTETENDKTVDGKAAKKYYRVRSLSAFQTLHPHKVRITLLGEIIE